MNRDGRFLPTLGGLSKKTRGITFYSAFVRFWLVDNLAELADVLPSTCFAVSTATALSVTSVAINRLASSEQSQFCHMGYCTDTVEIGFFDGKRANGEDSSECVHFYEGRHAGSKRTSDQRYRKQLLWVQKRAKEETTLPEGKIYIYIYI